MFNGLNNKLANVPTATGLSDVTADSVTTSNMTTTTLTVDGVDIGSQVAINTADITGLKQVTTGQTYASVGDTTTFDNNMSVTKTATFTLVPNTPAVPASANDLTNKNYVDNISPSKITTTVTPASPPAVNYYPTYVLSATSLANQTPYVDPDVYYNSGNNTLNVPNLTSVGTVSIKTNTGTNNSTLFIQDTGTGNSINFLPRATIGGALNNIVQAEDAIIFSNKTAGQPLCITTTSIPAPTAPTGIRLTSTSAFISGGGSGTTSTSSANFTGSAITFTGVATFTDVPICATAPPSANYLANKAYVDSVASSSTSINLTSDNSSGNWYIPFSKTTTATGNVLYIDNSTTPFYYDPSFNTLTVANLAGNASSATAVGITNTTSGTTYYIPFVDASSGTPILRTYAADLGYDATNQRLKITGITPNNGRNISLNGTPFGNSGNIYSIVMGLNAGPTGTMPNNCFCFGSGSGQFLSSTGVQNLFIGANSGNQVTSGRNNVFLGASAGRKSTTASYNTQIGSQSQSFPDENISGSYNTTIGSECHILNNNLTCSTAIGAFSKCSVSNTIQLGRSDGSDNVNMDGTMTVAGLATFGDIQAESLNIIGAALSTLGNVEIITLDVVGTGTFSGQAVFQQNINLDNLLSPGTTQAQIFVTSGVVNYDATATSSNHYFAVRDSAGNSRNPLQITAAGLNVTYGDIVMFSNSITGANQITATQFNGPLNGNANSATDVNVTVTTTGTWYPVFVNTQTTGNKALRNTSVGFSFDVGNQQFNTVKFNATGSGQVTNTFTIAGSTPNITTNTANTLTIKTLASTGGNIDLASQGITGLTIAPTEITSPLTQPASNNSSTKIPTTAWVQSAITNGNSGSATLINITDNNTSTVYYPTFASSGGGNKALLYDTGTTPLSYKPDTGILTASQFNIPTTIASSLSATGANMVFTNNNIGGIINYIFNTATIPYTIFSVSEANSYFRSPLVVSTGSTTSANPTFTLEEALSVQGIKFLTNATGTDFNPINAINNASILGFNGTTSKTISLTTHSTTTSGVVVKQTEVLIGAGGTSATPTSSIQFNGSSASMNLNGDVSIVKNNITLSSGTSDLRIGLSSTGAINLIMGVSVPIGVNFSAGLNTIYGNACGTNMTAGATYNTLMGHNSAPGLTSGTQSTFIGGESGFQTANGTGSFNTCVGYSSGKAMTTSSQQNTLLGTGAGQGVTTGSANTFVGCNSGLGNASGFSNVFVGYSSGYQAGGASSQNVCVGVFSGDSMTGAAGGNTLLGYEAGAGIVTGSNNTIIGSQAGTSITGQTNICIGQGATVPVVANSNQIALGTSAETMFIRGGFNWRVGATIVGTTTLGSPLSQLYPVSMGTASQIITLPATTQAHIGAYIIFKRKANTTAFTINGGASTIVPINSISTASATLAVGTALFQVEMVFDGVNWCVIGQA